MKNVILLLAILVFAGNNIFIQQAYSQDHQLQTGHYFVAGYDEDQVWNFLAEAVFDTDGSGILNFTYSSDAEVPSEVSFIYSVAADGRLTIEPPEPGTDDGFTGFVNPDGDGFAILGMFEAPANTFMIGYKSSTEASAKLLNGMYYASGYDESWNAQLEIMFDGNGSGSLKFIYDNSPEEIIPEEGVEFSYTVEANGRLTINIAPDGEEGIELTGMISLDGNAITFVEVDDEEGWNIFTGYKSSSALSEATLDGRYFVASYAGADSYILDLEFDGSGGIAGSIIYSTFGEIGETDPAIYSIEANGRLSITVPYEDAEDKVLTGMVNADGSEFTIVSVSDVVSKEILVGFKADESTTSVEPVTELPARFSLMQNYPNPFNPTTQIRYTIPVQTHVTLEVFNILGQKVAILVNEEQGAGLHEVTFEAADLSGGLYLYRLQTEGFTESRQMLLIK